MSTFIAKYYGTCQACDERVIPGDEVIYAEGNELIHVQCPETDTPLSTPICPRCFLALPLTGRCDDCG